MASTRAPAVAEVLWELKRADKLATYCNIATRAGFSAGANGRAMITCMKTIRRDWPHLQWWRAIRDDRTVLAGEHAEELEEWGATITPAEDDRVTVEFDEEKLMMWDEEGAQVLASAPEESDEEDGGEEE